MNYLDWLRQENADAAERREQEQKRIEMIEAEIIDLRRDIASMRSKLFIKGYLG
jgi:hypothetical protein